MTDPHRMPADVVQLAPDPEIADLRARVQRLREDIAAFIAALFPFGTFLNDPMLKRKQAAQAVSSLAA